MNKQITIDDVQKALTIPEFDDMAAHLKMVPSVRKNTRPPDRSGTVRLGSVLILLYCREGELHLVLTRRRDDMKSHAGQISFPGGRHEEPESLQMTALREAQEEVGTDPDRITVLGELSQLYIYPSDFQVHPFVAWYANGNTPQFIPNPDEVADVIEVSLNHLLDPATVEEEPWTWAGTEMIVPFFAVHGYKVWGATAMMLSEFVERLKMVKNSE